MKCQGIFKVLTGHANRLGVINCMKCKYHLCQNEITESKSPRKKIFCCDKCSNKYYVDKKRLDLKFKSFVYKGAKCSMCGFKGLPACFDFHHKDASKKSFSISHAPHTRSWERTKLELDKCDLLCANCHRQVEFEKTMHLKKFIPELIEKYLVGRAGLEPATNSLKANCSTN